VEFFREAHLKSSLTNDSKDTNMSNSVTSSTNSSAPLCVNNSVSTVNSTKNVEETLPTLENILDTKNMVESQSSEKENLDDINRWLNDGLEYEDFEMFSSETECISTSASPTNFSDILNPAKFIVNVTNAETTVETLSDAANTKTVTSETATSAGVMLSAETIVATISDPADSRTATTSTVETIVATTSETAKSIGIMSNTENATSNINSQCYSTDSIWEKLTCNKSPRTQKHQVKASGKQMDIGVYFGLKPKQNVTRNKTEDVSGKVLQQKELHKVKEQLQTQRSAGKAIPKTKKCPFYKIVEGKVKDYHGFYSKYMVMYHIYRHIKLDI
jgi:hypothetical protein